MTDGTTPVRAVLFDMDGTLVDSEPVHHRALDDVLRTRGLRAPEDFHASMTGRTLPELHRGLVDALGLAMTEQALAEAKYAAFLQRRGELRLRAGAAEALALLSRRHVPLAVVSNSDRMLLEAALDAAGLTRPGLVSVSRNDVRRGKPEPEPYLRAAWLLQAEQSDCLVVEDSVPGVRAGLAAGMAVLAWPEATNPDANFPTDAQRLAHDHSLADAISAWLDRPSG